MNSNFTNSTHLGFKCVKQIKVVVNNHSYFECDICISIRHTHLHNSSISSYVQLSLIISVHFHSLGEHQQPHFPGLTRGLVAVLLYWDGKRCIANSLRTLIQSRQGKTWTLELRSVSGWWADQSSLFWVLLKLIRLKGVCIVLNFIFLVTWCGCFHVFLKHNNFYTYFCWIIGISVLLQIFSCCFNFWQYFISDALPVVVLISGDCSIFENPAVFWLPVYCKRELCTYL